jgi:hypothetical protein
VFTSEARIAGFERGEILIVVVSARKSVSPVGGKVVFKK